jgi:hypothetical protein
MKGLFNKALTMFKKPLDLFRNPVKKIKVEQEKIFINRPTVQDWIIRSTISRAERRKRTKLKKAAKKQRILNLERMRG